MDTLLWASTFGFTVKLLGGTNATVFSVTIRNASTTFTLLPTERFRDMYMEKLIAALSELRADLEPKRGRNR